MVSAICAEENMIDNKIAHMSIMNITIKDMKEKYPNLLINSLNNQWDIEKRSKLIESILVNYYIPNLIFARDTSISTIHVLDGHNRLFTMFDYIDNLYPLTTLNYKTKYKGLYFKDLPRFGQRKIEDYLLSVHIYSTKQIDVIKKHFKQ